MSCCWSGIFDEQRGFAQRFVKALGSGLELRATGKPSRRSATRSACTLAWTLHIVLVLQYSLNMDIA